MKKLLLIAVALGAALLAYRYSLRAAPISAYEKFAEAWVRGNEEAALHLAEGEEAWRAVRRHPRVGLVPAVMVETIHGVGEKIESLEKTDSGEWVIEAKQTVGFDPPGATSAFGGEMAMIFHHSVRLRKTPEGWKVVAFNPTLLETRVTRRL